uniref:Uncharacterized protein n=1 Tax=Anser cygnoides TaxID=8845 RepID=A0A8B9DFR2_ANSCY
MDEGAARAPASSQHPVQLPQKQLKSLKPSFVFFFLVPIIPTFLYTTEYKGANSSAAPRQPESAPSAEEASPFSSVFSYFDNSTVTVSGSTSTTEPLNGTMSGHTLQPPTSPPPPPSGCLEGEEFLANENVRVGLLFASKALVQLMVNPFVGLLTNRIGYHIPMFIGFIIMFLSTVSEYCPPLCPLHAAGCWALAPATDLK